jgi:hypothetical protein
MGFSRISGIILLKRNLWNRFTAAWTGFMGPVHESMGLIKRWSLATGSTARIKPNILLFLDQISSADLRADGYDGFVLDSSALVKSGVGRRHGQRLWGAPSSPYAASFSKPKAPTWSKWWEISVLTTYHIGDGPRIAGDGDAARLVLGDGEGGLWWSFGSQDMHRGFLELPSSFSTNQLLRTAAEKLEFCGYLGFGGFLTCGQKFTLWVAL